MGAAGTYQICNKDFQICNIRSFDIEIEKKCMESFYNFTWGISKMILKTLCKIGRASKAH